MGMGRQVPKLHISPSTFILQTAMAEVLFVVLAHLPACTAFVRRALYSLLALSSGGKCKLHSQTILPIFFTV